MLVAAVLVLLLAVGRPSLSTGSSSLWPVDLSYQTIGLLEARLSSPLLVVTGHLTGQGWNDWRDVSNMTLDGVPSDDCFEARPDGTVWSGSSRGRTADPCAALEFVGEFDQRALPHSYFVIDRIAGPGGTSDAFTFETLDPAAFDNLPLDGLRVGRFSRRAPCSALGIECPGREPRGLLAWEVAFEPTTGLVISFQETFDEQLIYSYEVTHLDR